METEEVSLFPASMETTHAAHYVMKFHLLDEDGRLYPTITQLAAVSGSSPAPGGFFPSQSAERAARRREADQRTFCLYVEFPSSLGISSARLAEAKSQVAAKLRSHFGNITLRSTPARTPGQRQKDDEQYFITPTERLTPKQFLNVSRQRSEHQPPLISIKAIDVGEHAPALVRMNRNLRSALGVRACCFTSECVEGNRSECDALDAHYESKRRPKDPTSGQLYDRRRAEKRARQEEIEERQRVEAAHVQQLSESAVADGSAPGFSERCRSYELGRCARGGRHAMTRHGDADETGIITCCSARTPGDEGYSAMFQRCPFAGSDIPCPYMGHDE
jgi:hypothetical protein